MRNITILGSTGSIGSQTLNVVRLHRDKFNVTGLVCGNNIQLLNQQIAEFRPNWVYIANEKLRSKVVLNGATMLSSASDVARCECDLVVSALVGVAGVMPTIAAIESGHDIALANKETLACCGSLITQLAREKNVKILPVDSEHSAIWQCLNNGKREEVKKLILTASGGAFRGKTASELVKVTLADALRHPTWSMGVKVTIDSATLMNKGLEVIEAMHLFQMPIDKIQVLIHSESIIHSMVEYLDNSIIAQLSTPSMELPIQLAIGYPERLISNVPSLDWTALSKLTFSNVDYNTFRCLGIALECARLGGLYPAGMNAANEIAVQSFIDGKISFLDIASVIQSSLDKLDNQSNYDLEMALDCDRSVREIAKKVISIC